MESNLRFNKKAIAWRRSEILRLLSMGHNQASAARLLNLDESVVSLDCKWLREQAKETIRKFLDEQLPSQVQLAFSSYDQIIQESWAVANSSVADKRTKLQALAIIKDTVSAKLDLASNVDVVSHVMDLAQKKKQNQAHQEEEEHQDTELEPPTEHGIQTSDEEIEEESQE
jgi:hypothetical protein